MKCAVLNGERTRINPRKQDMQDNLLIIVLVPRDAAAERALMGQSEG